ncbi:MAG: hypothetical protein ORN24_06745, partial [Burkholderiales bacterium]|nr:hypothetical protein [Burkholderiales bacterium]
LIIVTIGNIYLSTYWEEICEILYLINLLASIILSFNLFTKLSIKDQPVYKWHIISMFLQLITTMFYFIVNYILFIYSINQKIANLYLIPALLWVFCSAIFWATLVIRNYSIKKNYIVISSMLLINICLFYTMSKLEIKHSINPSIQFLFFQHFTNLGAFIVLNCALYVLICGSSLGTKLLAASAISFMGANYLSSYAMFTYNPFAIIHRNDFWLFSSTLGLSGIIYLLYKDNYANFQTFIKDMSFRNIITAWTICVIVMTFSLFLILIYSLDILNNHLLAILPYFMFLFIIFATLISLFVSYIFEVSIKQITAIVEGFIKNSATKTSFNKIIISEFLALNDLLVFTMNIIKERNRMKDQIGIDARKVVHDVTSPISSITTIIKNLGSKIPQSDQETLKIALDRISGISRNFLNQYESIDKLSTVDNREILIASLTMTQFINEKNEQLRKLNIKIGFEVDSSTIFVFIKTSAQLFKSILSEIVRVVTDSIKDLSHAAILIRICNTEDKFIVIIKDNGHGISKECQDSFFNSESIFHSEINKIKGSLEIYTNERSGTKIFLRIPIEEPPAWIMTCLTIYPDSLIIIVDDDQSIHGAWDSHFEDVIKSNPAIRIKHFLHGEHALEFINTLPVQQQEQAVLLSDYELLNQSLNGLMLIEKAKIGTSILVTSYSSDQTLIKQVIDTGVQLLPKEFINNIAISVDLTHKKYTRKVDLLWLEDQKYFVDNLVNLYYKDLLVDVFYDPISFMQNIDLYPLNTRIILDTLYEYDGNKLYETDGFIVAKKLHNLGYTNIILFTGEIPNRSVPPYLKVTLKTSEYDQQNLHLI